jgi:O-methyltransferase involved in polyketide biosynthesis
VPTTLAEDLRGVMETLLITLYIRAMESQRPDALIHDEKAVEVFRNIGAQGLYDFGRMKSLHLGEENRLVIVLRNREIDRIARDFMARRPDAAVVHIGCGLDTRFQRVDDGRVEWYDLDFPDVVDLRRRLIGAEGERHHLLGSSVVEDEWLETVDRHGRRPFLFLAEGVFMYLAKPQVKRLVFTLRDRFPGAELVFDAYSPIHVWRHNLQYGFAKIKFPVRWGIRNGREMEAWGGGIRLLGEWGYFDEPTPRLNRIRWMRGLESVVKTFRVYRFRLGEAAG